MDEFPRGSKKHDDRREGFWAPGGEYWWPGLIAEVILCFLWWCSFCEFMPTVWFGPLSIVAPTQYGEEFWYAAGLFSPLLLNSVRVRRFILEETSWSYALTLFGIPSYTTHVFRTRTIMITLGVAFGLLVHFAHFFLGPKRRHRAVWCHLLALFGVVSVRLFFTTLIPIWSNTYTTWFFFLGGLGLAGVLAHDPEFSSLSERSFDLESQIERPTNRNDNSFTAKHASTIGCVRFGVGFGVLMFLTHWLCTSHGVIARWIGIEPYPSGIGIVASIGLGIYLNNYPSFVRSIWWWLAAVIAGPFVLIASPKVAIVLGYLVTTYIMSIWYVAVADLSKHGSPVLTLNISMGVYFLGMIGVIWSVAWCFVPPGTGGPYMRQRVGQLFAMSLLFVSLAYFKGTSPHLNKNKPTPSAKSKPTFSTKQILQILVLIIVLVTIPAIIKRSVAHGNFDSNNVQKDYIRGMIWAIRFGYNNFGWPNFKDVARKIREVESNLVGLVETDTLRPFTGNRDIVEFLQEHLHMYSDFGPATLNETWGCALMSAWPIIRSERENQPSPDGEIACLIDATIDLGKGKGLIDVIVTHFGNTEHYRDRQLQAQEIARRVAKKKAAGRKVVWLGYLTDRAGGPNYNRLIESGLTDASPQAVERYCLYLFHMGMEISEFERIEMTEDISDTEIQIANFKLPSTVAK